MRFLLLGLVAALAAPWAERSAAQEVISREYPIKAAYLYNFALYVRWSPETFRGDQEPFVIGIFGMDPFGTVLDEIAAKRVENRKIAIRRITSLDENAPCQILFIPKSTDPQVQLNAIKKYRTTQVLLVGETPGFAERGGAINFFVEENKLRFEVNQEAARRADPKISAKLLNLAKLVDDNGAAAPPQQSQR